MASCEDIIKFLDTYLHSPQITDVSCNGLQVAGKPQVKKIVFGVSASLALFKQAQQVGADLILVHHGLLWGQEQPLRGIFRERIAFLLKHNLSLAAYHLPLPDTRKLMPQRMSKAQRQSRELRKSKAQRQSKELRQSKAQRQSRELRQSKAQRQLKEPRQSKAQRQLKAQRQSREQRQLKAQRQSREQRQLKAQRQLREQRQSKAQRPLKAQRRLLRARTRSSPPLL